MPQPVGAARRPPLLQSAAMWLLLSMLMAGDVQQFPGAKVLPHDKYIHVVSEADSPVEKVYIKSKDGVYVAAAMRKPKGDGPFPVLVHFHGAPGGRGMEQLVGWARGDFGGPTTRVAAAPAFGYDRGSAPRVRAWLSGRASPSHGGGPWFESRSAHHSQPVHSAHLGDSSFLRQG